MTEEPSVLDYIKSKLNPWKYPRLDLPAAQRERNTELPARSEYDPQLTAATPIAGTTEALVDFPTAGQISAARVEERLSVVSGPWPWRALLALSTALVAQLILEPPEGDLELGSALYLIAAIVLVWSAWSGEWIAAPIPEVERLADPLTVRRAGVLVGVPLALIAFLSFKGGLFTTANLFWWYFALVFLLWAFWLESSRSRAWLSHLAAFLARPQWSLSISRWTLLVLAVTVLAVFFRTYQLNQVPPEMNSDHAEKLLDVGDVLAGQYNIFFPRNTGREALQFYLIAATAKYFGTGISFTSMKIGTILAGLLTLPFIYLLGKEVANRRVGLLAVAFAGIAYWPNVIARLSLRFAFYPLFVAPALYFLIRGLRRSNRNDFILSGIFLGIGLHGYTPIRILPFVIIIAVAIYLLHKHSQGVRNQTILYLALLASFAMILFLPLARYAFEYPDLFAYRAFTRLGDWERPLPGPGLLIFLQNLWNAMIMFGWDNGEVWTVSIPHRPALDVVSAALFYLGMVLLLVRYLRRRHWLDLFLLLSVPLLMLPSILSLAFPEENPVLSRTSGAVVTVFLIVGIAADGLFNAIRSSGGQIRKFVAAGLMVVLILLSSQQNYDLVFHQYYQNYRLSSWNTSEIGQVIAEFADTIGNQDSAWVMGYPHWVDTRLVGINAGYPAKDYAMFVEQLDSTTLIPGAKLFIIHPDDAQAVSAIEQLYPRGSLKRYSSKVETKDFLMYFVPPE